MKGESLKLQAYNMLKDKITRCEYAPGSQMNEEILQRDLGMSRTPIRDALGRLEQEGLIVIRPKKGITIAPLSIKELNMTFELRQLLECYALRNYGSLLPDDELMSFYRTFTDVGACPETFSEEKYYQWDDDFHKLLMSVVPNVYIAQSYRQILDQNTRFRVLTGHRTQRRITETSAEHLAILTACLQRDWERAAEAMRRHLIAAKASAFDLLLEQGIST